MTFYDLMTNDIYFLVKNTIFNTFYFVKELVKQQWQKLLISLYIMKYLYYTLLLRTVWYRP